MSPVVGSASVLIALLLAAIAFFSVYGIWRFQRQRRLRQLLVTVALSHDRAETMAETTKYLAKLAAAAGLISSSGLESRSAGELQDIIKNVFAAELPDP